MEKAAFFCAGQFEHSAELVDISRTRLHLLAEVEIEHGLDELDESPRIFLFFYPRKSVQSALSAFYFCLLVRAEPRT